MHYCVPAVLLVAVVAVADDPSPAKDPIPPRTATLNQSADLGTAVAAVAKQTGLPVTVAPGLAKAPAAATFTDLPAWDALERLANQAGARLALHEHGRRVELVPRGDSVERSSVQGAFRTVARQVVGRLDLETGRHFHEVQLDAHWEPRVPVFRADSVPVITRAQDDRGVALTASVSRARGQPTGSTQPMAVRLAGLTRASRSIAVLAGHYTVTAADRMLVFKFDHPGGKLPITAPPQAGVTAELTGFSYDRDLKTWEARVELTYPPGAPAFESFEAGAWLSENRARLVAPGAAASFAPDDYEIPDAGRRVVAVYRFKERVGLVNPTGAGWALVYETPSPLAEVQVPFELKDIRLP